jgi:hypothetical protein
MQHNESADVQRAQGICCAAHVMQRSLRTALSPILVEPHVATSIVLTDKILYKVFHIKDVA